jgi:hypothetical protein
MIDRDVHAAEDMSEFWIDEKTGWYQAIGASLSRVLR